MKGPATLASRVLCACKAKTKWSSDTGKLFQVEVMLRPQLESKAAVGNFLFHLQRISCARPLGCNIQGLKAPLLQTRADGSACWAGLSLPVHTWRVVKGRSHEIIRRHFLDADVQLSGAQPFGTSQRTLKRHPPEGPNEAKPTKPDKPRLPAVLGLHVRLQAGSESLGLLYAP